MRAMRPVIVIATAAVTVAWTGTGWPSPGQAPARAAVAAQSGVATPSIPAPTAQGSLSITGHVRDGGVVKATGLYWRPGPLPRSEKLLSFEVAYAWRACAAKCVTAADSTATPFAANRYVVGHGDTGKRLEVTETATEVVETDPATFAFSVVHASASYTTPDPVRGYRTGQPPATEFVNGTPERQTASDAEYFQVYPPHFAAASGTPVQHYRVDHGGWRLLPSSRVFYTGLLAAGRHQVAVRTSDAAGATMIRFSWRVVPMPAPAACRPRHDQACWYPPHLNSAGTPMRWDWQIGRVTPLQRTGRRAVDIYDVDGFLTTRTEVARIHARWRAATLAHPKLICYLDLAWEDYRPDASPGQAFPADTLGGDLLRLPAGALGRLPPAGRAEADAGRTHRHVRAEGIRRRRARRHR